MEPGQLRVLDTAATSSVDISRESGVTSSDDWVMQTELRINSHSRPGIDFAYGFYLGDGNRSTRVGVASDKVGFLGFGGNSWVNDVTHSVNTTDAFHLLRVTKSGSVVSLFVDDLITPSITMSYDDMLSSGTTLVFLTDTSSFGTADFAIRSFAYSAGTTLFEGKWNVDAGGNWSDQPNWLGLVPNGIGYAANFTDAISAARTVTVDGGKTVTSVLFDNASRYTLGGSGSLTINGPGNSSAIRVDSGGHTIAVPVRFGGNTGIDVADASSLTITSDLSATAAGVTVAKTGSGTLEVKNVRAASLHINGGRVDILPSGTSDGATRVELLTISGSNDAWTTTLDVNNNVVVVDYLGSSPISTIQNQLKSGFNIGSWNGTGITSSAAAATSTTSHRTMLGFAEASIVLSDLPGVFFGQEVDATTVLIRYTLAGDSSLDGSVNGSDFNSLASHFGTLGNRWTDGDSNYDGTVDSIDFNLLASNFGLTVSPGGSGASVPECALGWLVVSGLLLATRRPQAMVRARRPRSQKHSRL